MKPKKTSFPMNNCYRNFYSRVLIRKLADMNGDGKMDKKEFSIAMHLIKKKLQGYELPKTLPASLKADPYPVIGSFGAQPMNVGVGMPGSVQGITFTISL